MYPPDLETFTATLRQLSEVFGKPLSDGMVRAYWEALKDQPLGTVQRMAAQCTRYGKFFPKPSELRPKEDRPAVVRDAASDAKFKEGEARAIANLEELRQQDPVAWRAEVANRHLARILARTSPSSPIYAQALQEWQENIKAHRDVA